MSVRWVVTAALLVASSAEAAPAPPTLHPGAFDSASEFATRAAGLRHGVEPWASDFAKLRANSHDRSDYQPRPLTVVVRGAGSGHGKENYAVLFNDAAAAYALALDWRLTGDAARGAAAARILEAWAASLEKIDGTADKYLAAGLYGYQLAVAGETLRGFPAFPPAAASRVAHTLVSVFAPMNRDFLAHHHGAAIDHYWANWDLANVASLMAIGVFADRRDFYDEAKAYYLHGAGNGAIGHAARVVYPDGLAQWQESGRDQGHTLLGLGLAGTICEIAWHQGDDLFAADGNRLLAAARYVARYNLGQDVPFTPYANGDTVQNVVSPVGRGQARPVWALLVAHYVQRRHLPAPEVVAIMRREGAEGGGGDYGPTSGGFDQLGYGTLTFLEPEAAGAAAADR